MSATKAKTVRVPTRLASLWNVVWRTGRCVIIAYISVVVLMLLFERRLVFPSEPWDPEIQFEEGSLLKEVTFLAADGVKLHALYRQRIEPRVVILYLHGNGGNIGDRAGLLRFLSSKYNASVFGLSYRGYGKSDGKPSENGLDMDAQAALQYLVSSEQVDIDRVLIICRSMGAAVGLKLAIDHSVPAICIESTFTSLPDVAAAQYPWMPVRLLMRNRFSSLSRIGRYRGRLLQSHGDDDELIPLPMARQLHAAASCPKEFCLIPNGTHNSPQTENYYALVELLITQCYDQSPRDPNR